MVKVIVLARTKLKDVTCSLVIPLLIWEGCYLQFGNSFFDLGNVVSALDDKFDHKSVG